MTDPSVPTTARTMDGATTATFRPSSGHSPCPTWWTCCARPTSAVILAPSPTLSSAQTTSTCPSVSATRASLVPTAPFQPAVSMSCAPITASAITGSASVTPVSLSLTVPESFVPRTARPTASVSMAIAPVTRGTADQTVASKTACRTHRSRWSALRAAMPAVWTAAGPMPLRFQPRDMSRHETYGMS